MPERVIFATRGNHGQSVAFAAAAAGVEAVIVVPRGNNPEKNAAIEGYGAKLLVEVMTLLRVSVSPKPWRKRRICTGCRHIIRT